MHIITYYIHISILSPLYSHYISILYSKYSAFTAGPSTPRTSRESSELKRPGAWPEVQVIPVADSPTKMASGQENSLFSLGLIQHIKVNLVKFDKTNRMLKTVNSDEI